MLQSKTKRMVGIALLSAIVIVLQLLGSFIRFGPVSVSLVLIPIVVGAAMYGPAAGAVLGAVFSMVVLFQPELRRILEQMGSRRFMAFLTRTADGNVIEKTIHQTVQACSDMSQTRTGALIVFEREMLMDDLVRSGTVLDAAVSSELLKNIFFVKAPMHDGAVIVRSGRVLGAGCMLPLSKNVNLSRDLGMRHRAGIGISENSDAVVVIVSEETGSISVAIGGMLKRHLKAETLENLLRNELLPQEPSEKEKKNVLSLLHIKKNGGAENE